jgi:penicillin-binding protein 2
MQKHMPPHGSISLSQAIKVSCNAFFYQYGNAAGIDNIDAVGEALCLGQKSGIEITDEKSGILPGLTLKRSPPTLSIFS